MLHLIFVDIDVEVGSGLSSVLLRLDDMKTFYFAQ